MQPADLVEHLHWHPVAQPGDVPAAAPLPVRLLGEDLVLWRDAAGGLQVFADRCPHRGTRLSLGRVCEGQLECPYHGWRFEGSGRCVHIPAVPDFTPPATHAARRHETAVAYGLVWVRLASPTADAATPELPVFDAEGDTRLRKLLCGPYDVATSAPRIVENFLDVAHFGFVHEGWLGECGHTGVAPYEVEVAPGGVQIRNVQAWQPRSNRLSQDGSWVAYDYAVTGPYTALLSKAPEQQQGYRESIGLFVCPTEPERSRVWFRLAVPDFASSDDELRAFQHTIFTQDQPVLESQVPKRLPVLAGGEVHCAADRSAAAYRRYLREQGITHGVC